MSRDGGFAFVGFEDTAGYIGRALVTDIDLNSTVVTVDNLEVQSVPEPSTWAMMLIGFAGLGFAFRHSRRRVSLA